jgi:hypothetical protein
MIHLSEPREAKVLDLRGQKLAVGHINIQYSSGLEKRILNIEQGISNFEVILSLLRHSIFMYSIFDISLTSPSTP